MTAVDEGGDPPSACPGHQGVKLKRRWTDGATIRQGTAVWARGTLLEDSPTAPPTFAQLAQAAGILTRRYQQ